MNVTVSSSSVHYVVPRKERHRCLPFGKLSFPADREDRGFVGGGEILILCILYHIFSPVLTISFYFSWEQKPFPSLERRLPILCSC